VADEEKDETTEGATGAEPAESAEAREEEPVAEAQPRPTGPPPAPPRSAEERAAEREERRRSRAASRRAWRASRRRKRRERAGEAAPRPEARPHGPGKPRVRQGVVVSSKADKTLTVRIDVTRQHRAYKKTIRESSTLHAHDERNEAREGDKVRVVESRPLSRLKRWRLLEVLERAR
jgi:small subunit ribosomal protein S17